MKRSILTILVTLMAVVASYAQTIAVVSSAGETTMYQTLDEAVLGASSGSVIYLPGGGFQLNDTIRIRKKLTIMGVSHRADTDNADGSTLISGNIWFNQGAGGSAVMGIHLAGGIAIGEDQTSVNNILIRHCDLLTIEILNPDCTGTVIDQCYIRKSLSASYSSVEVTNNLVRRLIQIKGGTIYNNIITTKTNPPIGDFTFIDIRNCVFRHNIWESAVGVGDFRDCDISDNLSSSTNWGENCIVVGSENMFVNSAPGISPTADWHFTEEYQDFSDYGIYGGTGFNDEALAPMPRIVSKSIPEQTDGSGQLNVTITVKAK